MKKLLQRSLSVLLAVVLLCGIVPFSRLTASAAGYATGDIISFGSYPQTKVTNSSLITSLNAQTLQADQTVVYDGSKYKRVFFTTATRRPTAITSIPSTGSNSSRYNGVCCPA